MGVYNNGKSIYQKKPKPIKRQVPWKKPGFSSKTRGFRIQQFFTIALSHDFLSLRCSICKFSHQHGPHHIFLPLQAQHQALRYPFSTSCMKPSMIQDDSGVPLHIAHCTHIIDAGPDSLDVFFQECPRGWDWQIPPMLGCLPAKQLKKQNQIGYSLFSTLIYSM